MVDNLAHDAKLDISIDGASTLYGMPNTLYRLLLNLAHNAKAAGLVRLPLMSGVPVTLP